MLDQTVALDQVFADVLEAMAFLAPAPLPDLPACPPQATRVAMRFGGCGGGSVELTTGLALGTMIADMLLDAPEDPAVQTQRAGDALKELLNVYTGELLRRSGSSEPEMQLPSLDLVSAEQWQQRAQEPQTLRLDVDSTPALLRVLPPEAPAC